jgi:hypothetical protein
MAVTKIDLRRRKAPDVGELSERVIVCTTVERPDEDVSTIVNRPGVFACHARIINLRPEQILDYKAVFGTEHAPPTVAITIRFPPDVKVDLNHWVFCRNEYGSTWYKVRSTEDLGNVHRFLTMNCSIDTVDDVRSDPATQASPPSFETPDL